MSELIIVGSRNGGRSNFASPTPISAINEQQIDHAATLPGETGSIIAAFAPSFEFPRYSNDGAADTVRTGQLRGLKPDETLVLINGKRAHTTSVLAVEGSNGLYTAPFDYNTVPTNAIERIEVLTDGAGAQYGSDAIAGVINLVLKKSTGTGQLTASYGQYHTDFAPIGQTLNDGQTYSLNGDYGWKIGDRGYFHAGFEAEKRFAANRAGYTQDQNGVRGPIPWEANPYAPNSADNSIVALAGRVMAAGDGRLEGFSAFFNAGYQFSPIWEGYAFGTASYRASGGDAFFRWPADWGGSGVGDNNRNPGPVYPNGYRPYTHGVNNDISLTVGAKGILNGWDSDVSMAIGNNDFDWGVSNSLNPSFGTSSPKSFHLYGADFTQVTANADFSRHVDIGTGRPLLIATGAEYRYEYFSTSAGDLLSYTAGPLVEDVGAEAGPGVPPEDTAGLNRSVEGAYLELSNELTTRLSLDAAARYESYSDFGSTLNGKLAGRLEFTPELALRGSVSSNYRAPSLAQLGTQVSSLSFNSNASGLVTTLTAAPDGPIARALGFTSLKPEKSTNYNVGLVFKHNGLTASLDAYDIFLKDALDVYSQIIGGNIESYLLAKTGRDIQSVQLLQNIDALERSGYDISTKYQYSLLGGTGETGVNLTTGRSRANTNSFPVPSQLSALGYQPQSYQTPVSPFGATVKAILHNSWTNGDWSVFGRITRWDNLHIPVYGETYYHELPVRWTTDFDITKNIATKLSLSIGGQNVFDVYPKRDDYNNTYYGGLPYPTAQMGFMGAYYYVKLRYELK